MRQPNDQWKDNQHQEDFLIQAAKMFSHLDFNRLASTLEGHPVLEKPKRNESSIYQHLVVMQRDGRIERG